MFSENTKLQLRILSERVFNWGIWCPYCGTRLIEIKAYNSAGFRMICPIGAQFSENIPNSKKKKLLALHAESK